MSIDVKYYNIFVKKQGEEDTTYKGVGCCIGYENLLHKGTRDLRGNICTNIPIEGEPDDNGKRLKRRKFDNGSITYTYSPIATDGRKELNDAYENESEDIKLTIKFVMNDLEEGYTAPTFVERDILVSSIEPQEDDEELVEKATVEFLNAPRKTDRVASV